MTRYLIPAALLLVLGLSLDARSTHKDEIIDLSKGVPIASRVPCDGVTSPADDLPWHVSFSQGGWERAFNLNVHQEESCQLDLKLKCIGHQREGWQNDWITDSDRPATGGIVSLRSCYQWGTKEPAQYVLSGWYKEGSANPKLHWKQAVLKKVSSNPDVYEFSDPKGDTARLEITIR